MIIHIGDGISLFKEEIMMIIDRDSLEGSEDNREILENSYIVNSLAGAKSYIITKNKDLDMESEFKVYESNISARALFKRSARGY